MWSVQKSNMETFTICAYFEMLRSIPQLQKWLLSAPDTPNFFGFKMTPKVLKTFPKFINDQLYVWF